MNVQALLDVLPLAGKGLGGVFLVILLVWLSILALTKCCK